MDDELLRALSTVVDPELGIDVVNLGLIYEARREGGRATVVMTMTTPACPMHGQLLPEAREAVGQVRGIEEVDVSLTFEPRWTPDRVSAQARELLGLEPAPTLDAERAP